MQIRTTRIYTTKLIELCEQNSNWEWLAKMCLNYMSERDVKDMAECENVFDEEDNDEQ